MKYSQQSLFLNLKPMDITQLKVNIFSLKLFTNNLMNQRSFEQIHKLNSELRKKFVIVLCYLICLCLKYLLI